MSGPLTQVLDAFRHGAGSITEVGERTGLDDQLVRACVDHLVRSGRLSAKELSVGCPSGGCGHCASGTAEGTPGCGAGAPSRTRSGPVLVELQLRPPH